jgi:hypothetical protein
MLALWPRTSIARDSGLRLQAPGATEFTIGHNVNDRQEVEAIMQQAEAAGAEVVKPAGDTFDGGYAGYFRDPAGHLWEVAGIQNCRSLERALRGRTSRSRPMSGVGGVGGTGNRGRRVPARRSLGDPTHLHTIGIPRT